MPDGGTVALDFEPVAYDQASYSFIPFACLFLGMLQEARRLHAASLNTHLFSRVVSQRECHCLLSDIEKMVQYVCCLCALHCCSCSSSLKSPLNVSSFPQRIMKDVAFEKSISSNTQVHCEYMLRAYQKKRQS